MHRRDVATFPLSQQAASWNGAKRFTARCKRRIRVLDKLGLDRG